MTWPSIPSALAYNDEPSLRGRFESVPGWGWSWLWSISRYRPNGSAYIAAASGISTVTVFDPCCSQPLVRWKPFGEGVILTPDVATYVRVCVKLVLIAIVLTGLPWGRFGFVSNRVLTQRPGQGGRTSVGLA